MTEGLLGTIIGLVGVFSVFSLGFEVGKYNGLRKAEKMFDEVTKRHERGR